MIPKIYIINYKAGNNIYARAHSCLQGFIYIRCVCFETASRPASLCFSDVFFLSFNVLSTKDRLTTHSYILNH